MSATTLPREGTVVDCGRCKAPVVLTALHLPEASGEVWCDPCVAADNAWHREMNGWYADERR